MDIKIIDEYKLKKENKLKIKKQNYGNYKWPFVE